MCSIETLMGSHNCVALCVLSLFCGTQEHLAGITLLVNSYSDHDAGSCGPSMLPY